MIKTLILALSVVLFLALPVWGDDSKNYVFGNPYPPGYEKWIKMGLPKESKCHWEYKKIQISGSYLTSRGTIIIAEGFGQESYPKNTGEWEPFACSGDVLLLKRKVCE